MLQKNSVLTLFVVLTFGFIELKPAFAQDCELDGDKVSLSCLEKVVTDAFYHGCNNGGGAYDGSTTTNVDGFTIQGKCSPIVPVRVVTRQTRGDISVSQLRRIEDIILGNQQPLQTEFNIQQLQNRILKMVPK
jgi:hypothetical protein